MNKVQSVLHRLRARWKVDPSQEMTPAQERSYLRWRDQGLLREFKNNQLEIAPGVYRSNYPSPERLKTLAEMGLKSVLSLRGMKPTVHLRVETRACAQLGLAFHTVGLSDRRAPQADHLRALFEAFDQIERPFLIHCKAGADRAGLASALYLMEYEDRPLAEARKMLSLRFGHIRWSKAGIVDAVLDVYEERLRSGPIRFRAWLDEGYDPEAVTAAFRSSGPLSLLR